MRSILIPLTTIAAIYLLLSNQNEIANALGADANGMIAMRPSSVLLMLGALLAFVLWSMADNYQDTRSNSMFAKSGAWFGVCVCAFVAVGVVVKILEVL